MSPHYPPQRKPFEDRAVNLLRRALGIKTGVCHGESKFILGAEFGVMKGKRLLGGEWGVFWFLLEAFEEHEGVELGVYEN
jgi:hypothetical protein